MTKAERILSEVARDWKPPKQLSVSQWADEHFVLSPEYAAEAGRWSTLSFQREPLDTVSDPNIWQTVIKSCTQLLKTTVIQIGTAYVIDQDPGPILIIQPRDDDAKAFSKERIAPMIRDVPCLRGKVSESKAKKSANTIEEKWFKGGLLACTSAGSPGNLARRAIRFLFCDEEDKWVASSGNEGKPFSLALKRTATFRHRKKAIRCCSPTRPGSSIDVAYEQSDQREFYVPCPACGHVQSMMGKFRTQVRWDSKLAGREQQSKSARYHCEQCDSSWDDAARWGAIDRGQWRANAPFSGVAGFWISELYSPWKQLWEIVLDYLVKKDSQEDLITFVNTSLAENWTDPGEALEWERLLERREDYTPGVVPAGGLFLAAGVDVQREAGGRIEVEIVAFGRNRESWSVDYRILQGNPAEPMVWADLADVLNETFPTASGARLPISRMFVDSGDGTITNYVYGWVRTQDPARVTAIKGYEGGASPVGQPSQVDIKRGDGTKDAFGLKIKTVKPSHFKGELYAALKLRPPTEEEIVAGLGYPPGYCHFPKGKNYGDEHFKQLTAEQLTSRKNRKTGRIVMEWQQIRPRNEALDCRVYARAAAWDFGLDQAQEEHWRALEEQIGISKPLQPAAIPPRASRDRESAPPPGDVVVWRDAEREQGRHVGRKNWFSR